MGLNFAGGSGFVFSLVQIVAFVASGINAGFGGGLLGVGGVFDGLGLSV